MKKTRSAFGTVSFRVIRSRGRVSRSPFSSPSMRQGLPAPPRPDERPISSERVAKVTNKLFAVLLIVIHFLGVRVPVERDVYIAQPSGLERYLSGFMGLLRRLCGFGFRRLADLIQSRVYGVSRIADVSATCCSISFFCHKVYEIYGERVMSPNESAHRWRPLGSVQIINWRCGAASRCSAWFGFLSWSALLTIGHHREHLCTTGAKGT